MAGSVMASSFHNRLGANTEESLRGISTLPIAKRDGNIAPMWYYEFNGEQLGPVSESELQQRIAAGDILRSSLIWNETMSDWKPAGSTMAAAFEGVADSPYEPPAHPSGYTERSTRAPGSTSAKLAFALGITSIVVGILVGAIGLFLGFGAVFWGALLRNNTRRNSLPVPRHAKLAIRTGGIGVLLSILNLIGGVLLLKSRGML